MKRFTPPYRFSYPRFDPADTPAAKRILSFYNAAPEGISVYVLTDGTVTQVAPLDASTILHWYRGGYQWDISDADAAVLTAAGYTVTDIPAGVADHYVPPPTPRSPYPSTWDDLSAYTWDEAAQFLWGSFPNHV